MADLNRLKRKTWTTHPGEYAQMLRHFPGRASVIAEGDSWFAYPREHLVDLGRRSNVISHLRGMHRFNLLHLASNGDEALAMLSGAKKSAFLEAIHTYQPDFLLFSGGGNDVVGKWSFEFLLRGPKERGRAVPDRWENYVHRRRVVRRLGQVEGVYRDLIDYCKALSKETRIVTHTYDYAVPDPRGAVFLGGLVGKVFLDGKLGPWMYPYLRRKEVPRRFDAPIAVHLIDELAARLQKLAAAHPGRFIVADTRNTVRGRWKDEIHPKPDGFESVAKRVWGAMKPLVEEVESARAAGARG